MNSFFAHVSAWPTVVELPSPSSRGDGDLLRRTTPSAVRCRRRSRCRRSRSRCCRRRASPVGRASGPSRALVRADRDVTHRETRVTAHREDQATAPGASAPSTRRRTVCGDEVVVERRHLVTDRRERPIVVEVGVERDQRVRRPPRGASPWRRSSSQRGSIPGRPEPVSRSGPQCEFVVDRERLVEFVGDLLPSHRRGSRSRARWPSRCRVCR